MKPVSDIWDNFIATDDLKEASMVHAKKVVCLKCLWSRAPHPTRMRTHVEQCTGVPAKVDKEVESAGNPTKKLCMMQGFSGRNISQSEQEAAQTAQVFMFVFFRVFVNFLSKS